MSGPHQGQPLVTAGAPLRAADAAAVLVHGRGATADSVVRLADEFYRHGLALVAPQAERNRWYPNSFLAPVESNEPWLSSGLQAIGDAVAETNDAGIPTDRILLLGISQGACLVSEFAARDPARYGGVVAASGGLVGPELDADRYEGSLDGTPVLVSGTEEDRHVPVERLRETATVFERLGGDVTERIDEGSGHGASDADLATAGEMVTELLAEAPERGHRTDERPGLHHVSAIAGDPQANVDFYTDVLGLRFVKRTVNFDYEFMYHLYYGSETADPGTLITFFPYQRGEVGRVGQPQPSAVALTVPEGSSDYWYDRIAGAEFEVDVEEPTARFGDVVVRFRDHDGVPVELVESDSSRPPATDAIPAEYAVRGLHSVTLRSTSVYHTAATLEVFGFDLVDQEGDRVRYEAPGEDGAIVDILDVESEYGKEGIGTIHHLAFGAGDVPLAEWRDRLFDAGLEPTRITDRRYFSSVYARDPGGILFEVATMEPGFTVDEDLDELGSTLRLPPQYEADREMLESQLPEIVIDRD